MRILADTNLPAEYVAALGPEATDDAVVDFAESEGYAILSTDLKDFAEVDATVPVFVAPQGMISGAVRTAVARIEGMEFGPGETEPFWLSSL